MNAESTREALDVASLAGDILLASGAEIFRVEETIDRIARAYGVNSSDAFVLSSGIFLTAESGKKQEFARVRGGAARAERGEGLAARHSADAGQTKMAPGTCIRCRKRVLLFSVRRRCGGQHGSVSVGLCSVLLSAVPAARQNVKNCDEYFRRRACHTDCRFSVSGGDRPSSGQGHHRFDYSACARCQFHERHP